MTFFLNSQLGLSRSLRSNENRGRIFEAATLKFCNHSWKFGSSPWNGKVDLCMTSGSKVLIYLTLLYFLLHYLQEYKNMKYRKVKSIRTLKPFVIQRSTLPFWGEEKKFQEWLQNFEVAASKIQPWFSFDLNDLERPNWEFKKKCHGITRFFP